MRRPGTPGKSNNNMSSRSQPPSDGGAGTTGRRKRWVGCAAARRVHWPRRPGKELEQEGDCLLSRWHGLGGCGAATFRRLMLVVAYESAGRDLSNAESTTTGLDPITLRPGGSLRHSIVRLSPRLADRIWVDRELEIAVQLRRGMRRGILSTRIVTDSRRRAREREITRGVGSAWRPQAWAG